MELGTEGFRLPSPITPLGTAAHCAAGNQAAGVLSHHRPQEARHSRPKTSHTRSCHAFNDVHVWFVGVHGSQQLHAP